VRSLLGRFLEHSRIYHFVNGGDDEYWIGSADLMHRNLDRRVESLVRIDRPAHKSSLQEIFDLSLSDETASWHQKEDKWLRVAKNTAGEPLQDLQNIYIKRYKKVH
jgi:polyphosphate kinase